MARRKRKQPPPPPPPFASSSEEEEEQENEAPSNEKVGSTSKPKEVSEEEEEEAAAFEVVPTSRPKEVVSEEEEEEELEEDEEEEPEEESEDEDNDKNTLPAAKRSKHSEPYSIPKPAFDSSSESESEDESEDESSPKPKPISTKPMPMPATSKPTPPSKKLAITTVGDEVAKIKTPPQFQRLWSTEDELLVLNSLAEYKLAHGSVPAQNHLGAFRESIVDKLTMDVTTGQIFNKLRVFKKKFETVVKKGEFGKKPYDREIFELSRKIWGRESVEELVRNENGHRSVEEEDDVVKEGTESIGREKEYPFLKEFAEKSGLAAVRALEVVEEEKRNKLEGKLKRQKFAEVKLDLHRMEILRESVKLVTDGMQKWS